MNAFEEIPTDYRFENGLGGMPIMQIRFKQSYAYFPVFTLPTTDGLTC